MGIRTNGHLRRPQLPLILADAHTVHLHSTGFRTMVEAATLLDPHMKGHFYPSDIFGVSSTKTRVHRLCAHQLSLRSCAPDTDTLNANSVASLDLPMRKSFSSGALSSIWDIVSYIWMRILHSFRILVFPNSTRHIF
jgi:hypothetical protein